MKKFENKVWLSSPTMHGDELKYITEAYETNWMSTVGKNINEALQITNKAVMEALDGLPPVKVHCSLLAEEAIHAALWDYAEKNNIKIEGLEKPKTDISEGEEEEDY